MADVFGVYKLGHAMWRYRVELTLQTAVLTCGQDVRDPLTHVSPVYTGDYPPPTPHLYTGCYCTSFTLTVLGPCYSVGPLIG